MCMLREALLMNSYVIVICCLDALCSAHCPLSPQYGCHRTAYGSQNTWREVRYLCPLPSAFGRREGLLLGGVAWQHLTSNQASRKHSHQYTAKSSLTDFRRSQGCLVEPAVQKAEQPFYR